MKKRMTTILTGAIVAASMTLAATSANAWWGSWFPWDDGWGPWGGGPWGGYPYYGGYYPYYGVGYPYYGWGGYPYYGYGAYPWTYPVAPATTTTKSSDSK
jgi:hypothetical protein